MELKRKVSSLIFQNVSFAAANPVYRVTLPRGRLKRVTLYVWGLNNGSWRLTLQTAGVQPAPFGIGREPIVTVIEGTSTLANPFLWLDFEADSRIEDNAYVQATVTLGDVALFHSVFCIESDEP